MQSRSEVAPELTKNTENAGPVQPGTTRIVKRGEQLKNLAMEAYGAYNPDIIKLILKHNPQIQDVNRIDVGMQILFPPLPQ
jgi:hypothetical protein